MLTVGVLALVAVLYLFNLTTFAFWILILAIANGLFAVLMAIANPDWYMRQRSQAGLEIDYFNSHKGIGGLIATKSVVTVILGLVAWKLAGDIGYLK